MDEEVRQGQLSRRGTSRALSAFLEVKRMMLLCRITRSNDRAFHRWRANIGALYTSSAATAGG